MKNSRFKSFLSFNWQWYLIIFIGVVFVFYYLFMILNTPSYDEKIVVFIGVNYVDTNGLEEKLYSGYDDTKIEEVYIDYSDPNDSDYAVVFSTRGTVNTDVIIVSKSYIDDSYSRFFSSIDGLDLDGLECLYGSDGLIYGINVSEFLRDYIDYDEDLYLFFNKKSDKIGFLNDVSSNDYALKIIDNLIK